MVIDIMAVRESGGEEACAGKRDCMTALEAVMLEIAQRPARTAGAHVIWARDEWTLVMAGENGSGGYAVQVEDGRGGDFPRAVWFDVASGGGAS